MIKANKIFKKVVEKNLIINLLFKELKVFFLNLKPTILQLAILSIQLYTFLLFVFRILQLPS